MKKFIQILKKLGGSEYKPDPSSFPNINKLDKSDEITTFRQLIFTCSKVTETEIEGFIKNEKLLRENATSLAGILDFHKHLKNQNLDDEDLLS